MNNRLLLKLGVIVLLGLVMLVPLAMIDGVVSERSYYRAAVEHDIAATWTGAQQVVGPILTVPYRLRYEEKHWDKVAERYETLEKTRTEWVSFMPESLEIDAEVPVQMRSRGLYGVPVYSAALRIAGRFSSDEVRRFRESVSGFVAWGAPELAIAIADVRGIGAAPALDWDGAPVRFEPGVGSRNLGDGIHATLSATALDAPMTFSVALELRGSRQLGFAPVAANVEVRLASPWQHPHFEGRFLPVEHRIGADGFEARWQMSSFSTGAAQALAECTAGDCGSLASAAFGVRLIETVDLYQQATRAVKYGLLFIVLTFVAFFLTETLTARQLHPLHYLLVGCALSVFYLLLLSLSEHVGFASAYWSATAACVVLIGAYLSGVMQSRALAALYASGFAILYAMLFMILRSEDFALLMGSALLFAVLAAVMVTTRRVDWYALGRRTDAGARGTD